MLTEYEKKVVTKEYEKVGAKVVRFTEKHIDFECKDNKFRVSTNGKKLWSQLDEAFNKFDNEWKGEEDSHFKNLFSGRDIWGLKQIINPTNTWYSLVSVKNAISEFIDVEVKFNRKTLSIGCQEYDYSYWLSSYKQIAIEHDAENILETIVSKIGEDGIKQLLTVFYLANIEDIVDYNGKRYIKEHLSDGRIILEPIPEEKECRTAKDWSYHAKKGDYFIAKVEYFVEEVNGNLYMKTRVPSEFLMNSDLGSDIVVEKELPPF